MFGAMLNPGVAAPSLQQVDQELARFGRKRNMRFRFVTELETLFHEERAEARRRQLVHAGVFALGVFDLFLVGDRLTMPEHFVRALVVRLGIMTPLVLMTLALAGWRKLSAVLQERLACVLCVAGCAAVLYMQHGGGASAVMQGEPGLLLLLLAMNTLLRPAVWTAIFGTAFVVLMFVCTVAATGLFTFPEQLTMDGQVYWFAVLSLLANYALAREQRFSWLLKLRGRIQREMLTDANRELLTLTMQDPLTGVPNRAAYVRRLPELWKHAVETCEPLAAVMVDVDYFKQINDNFGHLYGDRVLQRIASLLEQAMRAEADFVARFGGEEFVVLLPGSTLEAGAQVAERIRVLVEVAGSPAVIRGDAPLPPNTRWSTVSCGVACVMPTVDGDPNALIEAADAALYKAKQTGRNRVCTSRVPTLTGHGW